MASQNFIARPALAVYNQAPTGPSDPYWDNVSLLLPFDGNDGDTTTTDVSSFSNTVSAFNGIARIESDQSKFGGTSLFTGTSGYNSAQISNSPSLDLNTGDWCVECWIRLSTLTFPASFAGVAGQSPRDGGPQFLVYFDGKVGWWWGFGNASFSGNTVLSVDTWYHVAWVRETALNTVKIYLNGVLDGSTSLSGSTVINGTGDWYVGEARVNELPFPGYIDDFRITKGVARYTENFTPPTAAHPTTGTLPSSIVTDGLVLYLDAANPQSYTGTTWFDLSGNGNNGTLTNGTSFVTDNEGSYVFDGNDDNIDFGNLTELNFSNVNFSFEVVFKKFTWDKAYQTIISKGDKTWRLSRYNLTSRLEFSTGSSTGLKSVLSTDVNDNIWYHVACVYNGSEHLLYLNGVLSNTTSGTTSISASDSQNLLIGDNSEKTDRQFEGLIPIVRIYNRALSEAEVNQNFNALRGRYGL